MTLLNTFINTPKSPLKSGLITGLFIMLATTVTVGSLTGCGADSKSAVNNTPIVTIDEDIVVTRGEYDKMFKEILKNTPLNLEQVNSGKLSGEQNMLAQQLKEVVLNKLIFMALIKDAAKDQNVEVSDEELTAFKTKNLKKIGGEEKLDALLEAKGLTEEEFNKNLREELLITEFIKNQPNSNVTVSPAEAQQFYNGNKQLFHLPKGLTVSHILVKIDPKEIKSQLLKQDPQITEEVVAQKIEKISAEKKELAEKLLAQVKADPTKFAELAKKHSDDPGSAVDGGHIDALYKDMTAPEFWNAAEKTGAGKLVPELVKTTFGYHIINVEKFTPAHQEPFSKVQDNIITVLEQQRQQKALMTWAKDKRKKVTFNFAEGFKPDNFTQPGEEKTDEKAASTPEAKPTEKEAAKKPS